MTKSSDETPSQHVSPQTPIEWLEAAAKELRGELELSAPDPIVIRFNLFTRMRFKKTVRGSRVVYRHLPEASSSLAPPAWAQVILTLIFSGRIGEGALGDLHQLFIEDAVKFGATRARWLYVARAANSIAPLLWAKAKKWGGIGLIFESVRRFFSG